jgi:hypothetical protein
MAKKATNGIDQQLRDAIESSELSLFAISQGSGVAYPQVYHFAHGARDIRLGTAARLAAYLGLELAPIGRR